MNPSKNQPWLYEIEEHAVPDRRRGGTHRRARAGGPTADNVGLWGCLAALAGREARICSGTLLADARPALGLGLGGLAVAPANAVMVGEVVLADPTALFLVAVVRARHDPLGRAHELIAGSV